MEPIFSIMFFMITTSGTVIYNDVTSDYITWNAIFNMEPVFSINSIIISISINLSQWQNKKSRVFRVTSQKNLGRVGTLFKNNLQEIKNNLMHFEMHFVFQNA